MGISEVGGRQGPDFVKRIRSNGLAMAGIFPGFKSEISNLRFEIPDVGLRKSDLGNRI